MSPADDGHPVSAVWTPPVTVAPPAQDETDPPPESEAVDGPAPEDVAEPQVDAPGDAAASGPPAAEPSAAEEPVVDQPSAEAAAAEEPAAEEPAAEEPAAEEPAAEAAAEKPVVDEPAESVPDLVAALRGEVAAMATTLAELSRLRSHDLDLADRMHAEIVRLRGGELTSALAPLLQQLLRLRDRMVDLSATDDLAAMVATQLEQILDTSADVHSFTPQPGDAFDPKRHQGVARIPTDDEQADSTVARTVKPGFLRGDGSLLRVAEVDVHRFQR